MSTSRLSKPENDNCVENPIYSDVSSLKHLSQRSTSESPPESPVSSITTHSPGSTLRMLPNSSATASALRCQISGVLSKRPFGHHSNRWSRRFFVLLDGYLLYYPESEKKDFEAKKTINIHPKGVLPLGGCEVEECEESNHPFSLKIKHSNLTGTIVIAAENEFTRNNWIKHLEEASRITYQNAELGEKMINRLESEGLRMALEKQDYYDKLQSETVALQSEKERNDELSKMAGELERQKSELKSLAQSLHSDLGSLRSELQETSSALNEVEKDRASLTSTSNSLQQSLKELQSERCRAEEALQKATYELQQQNQQSSEQTEQLKARLVQIGQQAQCLQKEKVDTELRLSEAEQLAQSLRQEKEDIFCHSQELESSLKELSDKKVEAEQELQQEVHLRQEAERQLKAAQEALYSLQGAVDNAAPKINETLSEQMQANVSQLKNFFERVALESLYDAKKPVLMKGALSAVRADTVLSRARTFRREAHKRMSRVHATILPSDSLTNHTMAAKGRRDIRASHISPV